MLMLCYPYLLFDVLMLFILFIEYVLMLCCGIRTDCGMDVLWLSYCVAFAVVQTVLDAFDVAPVSYYDFGTRYGCDTWYGCYTCYD